MNSYNNGKESSKMTTFDYGMKSFLQSKSHKFTVGKNKLDVTFIKHKDGTISDVKILCGAENEGTIRNTQIVEREKIAKIMLSILPDDMELMGHNDVRFWWNEALDAVREDIERWKNGEDIAR